MKILHLAKYYHPTIGGIEAITKSIAEYSLNMGFSVAVVSFSEKNSCVDQINGVKISRCASVANVASQPISFQYLRTAVIESSDSDIVHVHAPNILAFISVLLMDKKKKIIIHWHSDIRNKGILGLFVRPIEYFVLKRASKIISTTEVYSATSKSLESFSSKTSIIPLGIEVPHLDLLDSGCKFDLLPKPLQEFIKNKKVILSVGRLVKFKGIDVLIRAAPLLKPGAVVIIVGDGPERTYLENLVKSLDLSSRVLLVGALPSCSENGVLRSLFKCSHVFCLPSISRAESFGVVLLEAMLFGLPCVVSRIPGSGVNWVVNEDNNGLFFEVKDSSGLAQAINSLVTNGEKYSNFSKHGVNRVRELFDSRVVNRKVIELYKNII